MSGTKSFRNMTGFVLQRGTEGASTAAADRTTGSPTPAPRREGDQQNVFVKPRLPTASLKQSQQSNAAVIRTGSRHQQHPVQRHPDTRISTFDTDGESIADTTLDDTSHLSNQTYENQQYSYAAENNAMEVDHAATASYAHNFATSGPPQYSAAVAKVQQLAIAVDGGNELGITPAAHGGAIRTLSTWEAEFNEAHPNARVQIGGRFQSGASYPATSKSGVTDTDMREVQEYEGSDDESGQSEESQEEEGEGSEDDAPPDQQSDGAEEHEIYTEQQTQVEPPQQAPPKHFDHQHEKRLASRSASHQRAAASGQGQYAAALAAQQEDARVKQEAAPIEQERRDQERAKQKRRIQQEQQNQQQAQQEQAMSQKKQPQNVSQQRFSESAQQQQPSNIAQAKSGSKDHQRATIVAQQAAPQPATRQGQSEIRQNARLDSKEPSFEQPQMTLPQVASQGERPVELDYDETALKQMPYDILRNQSFDEDPQPPNSVLPLEMQSSEHQSEKLGFVASLDGNAQQLFFQSLPLEDWEEAGEWFMDQFCALMKKMRQTRQEKRQIAKAFEDAVSERYDAVLRKREHIDNVLNGMRESGSVVLKGSTPQKTKRASS